MSHDAPLGTKSGLFETDDPELAALNSVARHLETYKFNGEPMTSSYIPMDGWYFAFNIDAQTMYPFLPREQLAAFFARRKTYIGYLIRLSGIWQGPEKFLHPGYITILSPGPCADESQSYTSDMAVAVEPNEDRVFGREPLKAEPPLPWPCFYQPCVGAEFPNIRIRTRHLGCLKTWRLPKSEWRRAGKYTFIDEDRRRARAEAQSAALPLGAGIPGAVLDTDKQNLPPKVPHALVPGDNNERPEAECHTENSASTPVNASSQPLDVRKTQAAVGVDRVEHLSAAVLPGDSKSYESASPGADVSDVWEQDNADPMRAILTAVAEQEDRYPYSAVVDPLTYDLDLIDPEKDRVGTPLDYVAELEELHQMRLEYERQMHIENNDDTHQAFILARSKSMPPQGSGPLVEVPFRPYSVPPTENPCTPNTPEAWAAHMKLMNRFADKERDRAAALERMADGHACQAAKHVEQATECRRAAEKRRSNAAEFERDWENTKKLARFVGINVDGKPDPDNFVLKRYLDEQSIRGDGLRDVPAHVFAEDAPAADELIVDQEQLTPRSLKRRYSEREVDPSYDDVEGNNRTDPALVELQPRPRPAKRPRMVDDAQSLEG